MLPRLKPHQTTVAVTGANGFVASEIVSQLLQRGYIVHGTVRDPEDEGKVGHLKKFVGSENLKLFKAELTESAEAFEEAFRGCQVVIHTASPVTTGNSTEAPEKVFIEPALRGTTIVFDAISKASGVQTVVLTSSVASVSSNAGLLPETYVYSEKDWSPIDRMRELERWYGLGKTLAEKAAWDHELITSKRAKLVVVNPGYIVGRVTNSRHVAGTPGKWLTALKGEWESIPNRSTVPVDVSDVAKTHIRAFEDPDAEGRYVCVSGTFTHQEVVDAFNRVGAGPALAKPLDTKPYTQGVDLWDSSKCEKLIGGWRTLDQTCRDMAQSYVALGLLHF